MKSALKQKFFLVLLYPLIVGYTKQPAEEETWIDVIFGFGTIVDVVRDCNHKVIRVDHIPYADATVGLTYKTGIFTASAHVGYTSVSNLRHDSLQNVNLFDLADRAFIASVTNRPYLNTRVGIRDESFALEIGVTILNPQDGDIGVFPSGSLRIGRERGASAFLMNLFNPTLLAMGTAGELGFRLPVANTSDLYVGLGTDLFLSMKINSHIDIWNKAETHVFTLGGGLGLDLDAAPWSLTLGYKTKI